MVEPPAPPYLGPAAHTSGSGNKPIQRIVLHCTVSACATGARDIAAYFRKPTAGGSAHYVVDADEAVQVVFDSVIAWHAPPNSHSLGVELCCTLANQGKGHWERADHQAMLHQTAKLVAQLCLAYDVPMMKLAPDELRAGKRGLCGHVDVSQAWHESTHWDPGPFFPWGAFLRMVRTEAKKLTEAPAPTVPTTIPDTPGATGPAFTVGHVSGKWSAGHGSWEVAGENMLEAGASVITWTETVKDGLIESVAANLGLQVARLDTRPGESECAVTWLPKKWESAADAYAVPLATQRFKTSKGFLRPPVTAVVKALQRKGTNRRVIFGAKHDPSGIEGRTGHDGTVARLRAASQVTAGTHEIWTRARAQFPDAARVLASDFNRDYQLHWVRDWWSSEFPILTPCWEGNHPKRGTHGDRVIDWVAAAGLVVEKAHVLTSVKGLDHRPIVARLRFPS